MQKIWLTTKRDSEKEHYRHIDRVYKGHLHHNKKSNITSLLDNSKNRLSTLCRILRSFAKPEDNNPLPDINKEKLLDKFANYFLNEIAKKIREHFKGKKMQPIRPHFKVSDFKPLTEEQVLTLIQDVNHTICATDPCNTKCLMKFKHTFIKTVTKFTNMSLTTG